MAGIKDYEQQVYAGVLGKVIGVYMGRPFEGWSKQRLVERFGLVGRYVHEDLDKPLVVADDDISGTLTFIRALEDSGLYANTPDEAFGDAWLNYLIEGRTVLWWGGMGHSTEHTAYLRLKHGYKAPHSGSVETNGHIVAEQIGAQIFIDAFGMVAPGEPELAAKLARRSASVSHGGEAVNAAVVVAGMIAAAFVEKDMDRLLDIGVGLIDGKSLIARMHRDVREWCAKDGDWHKTYDRIDRKYGYAKYGGNCHVVPNHAIMVMAWAYAPDDFHLSQTIINTAGWDTDCNAANVGALMGVKVGLERINEAYDFQSPFADRIWLPTAEPTRGATDVLAEALCIARMGRKVMGLPAAEPPKGGAWHHFEMPGALHGYMSEDDQFQTRGAARLSNVRGHSAAGKRSLRIGFEAGPGRIARVSVPVNVRMNPSGGYGLAGTPRLYTGQTVTLRGQVGKTQGPASARLFVRYHVAGDEPQPSGIAYSRPVDLPAEADVTLSLDMPDTAGWPIQQLGIEISSATRAQGELFVDTVAITGQARLSYPPQLPRAGQEVAGWVKCADVLRGPFSDDTEPVFRIGKNEGRGVLVTGNTDWTDYSFSARLSVHLADRAGILVRYQGLQRYVALVKTADKLQLVLRHSGDHVLAETPARWAVDELHEMRIVAKGAKITAWCDGEKVLEGTDDKLGRGGAGFLFETGLIGLRDVKVDR